MERKSFTQDCGKTERRKVMKAINIIWDVDNKEGLDMLPSEIEIPEDMIDEAGEVDDDEISDYLSDVTGFCHKGYELV